MLRPRGGPTSGGNSYLVFSGAVGDPNSKSKANSKKSSSSLLSLLSLMLSFLLGMLVQNHFHSILNLNNEDLGRAVAAPCGTKSLQAAVVISNSGGSDSAIIPPAFDDMIRRARSKRRLCHSLGMTKEEDFQGVNDHNAHLTQFGLLDFIDDRYESVIQQLPEPYPYQCIIPPEEECQETQFTVIFMAYNPSRLHKMYNEIIKMFSSFQNLVKEVVVVWNGEREVEETKLGQALVDLTKTKPVRISYPLKAGFPNDLYNRYHPRLGITTKAIMYYDDDGPFYSYHAVLGGFELWKRNSNAQIGAMARKIDLNARQEEERLAILNGIGDRNFISQCPTDRIRYNFNEFAQFGARMVLPSGSFLHSNYLACLWHPIFTELHQYVQHHPVNPDDGTVSAIISHLSGRAPKVYSRRINEADGQKVGRRLMAATSSDQTATAWSTANEEAIHLQENDVGGDEDASSMMNRWSSDSHLPQRRRLMDGINWDAGGDHQKKHDWGKLRSDAANSLIRYFGSVNSGSIGWCYGTEFQQGEYCQPDQARLGQLPWLTKDHTVKAACP